MKAIDQTKIYQNYKGQWVILDDSRMKVLAAAKTLDQAVKKFQKQYGTQKIPMAFKVPTELLPYVGF